MLNHKGQADALPRRRTVDLRAVRPVGGRPISPVMVTERRSASAALDYGAPSAHTGCREKRLLAVGIAVSTQAMRALGSAFFWLERVTEATGNDFYKLVATLLSLPIAKAHHLCFKFLVVLQLIKLRRLGG